MTTLMEIEKAALELSEDERALLASHLLDSLPPATFDNDDEVDDDGIAEALRREAEYRADPSIAITLEELDRRVGFRRDP